MKDLSKALTYKGKKYKLVFNLNVLEEIQEEYGTFGKWVDAANGKADEYDVKAYVFAYTAMINEGIDMANEENGTDDKPLTTKQVSRILSEIGLDSAVNLLNEAVAESTQPGENAKNE